MEDLIAALEEESPVAVNRRATIGVGITASTPAASAPPVSGGKSVTAHVHDVKRLIAEFRDAGLGDYADELEAELKLFVRSMARTGSGSATTSPPANLPKGFSSSSSIHSTEEAFCLLISELEECGVQSEKLHCKEAPPSKEKNSGFNLSIASEQCVHELAAA